MLKKHAWTCNALRSRLTEICEKLSSATLSCRSACAKR